MISISSKAKLENLWLSRIGALVEYSNNNSNDSGGSSAVSVLTTPIDTSCAGEDDALSERLSKLEQVSTGRATCQPRRRLLFLLTFCACFFPPEKLCYCAFERQIMFPESAVDFNFSLAGAVFYLAVIYTHFSFTSSSRRLFVCFFF